MSFDFHHLRKLCIGFKSVQGALLYIAYTSTKACNIRYVFKFFLTTARDGEVLMERGSSFHSRHGRGAATTKDLSPHECLDLGSINSNFSFDGKFLEGNSTS